MEGLQDMTDSDDDLDITKAVRKDLGHQGYINSRSTRFNTVKYPTTD